MFGTFNDKRIGGVGPDENGVKALSEVRKWCAVGYNFSLPRRNAVAMEAERINQIAAKLEDLRSRSADLRRYL